MHRQSCLAWFGSWRGSLRLAFGLAMLLAAGGCSRAEFGEVSGKVLFGGKPFAGATLEFQPDDGSPSYGKTDDNGDYFLSYSGERTGAEVGQHTVRITGYNERINRRMKEPIPARFNSESELTREVKPGVQRFDFDLPAE